MTAITDANHKMLLDAGIRVIIARPAVRDFLSSAQTWPGFDL